MSSEIGPTKVVPNGLICPQFSGQSTTTYLLSGHEDGYCRSGELYTPASLVSTGSSDTFVCPTGSDASTEATFHVSGSGDVVCFLGTAWVEAPVAPESVGSIKRSSLLTLFICCTVLLSGVLI